MSLDQPLTIDDIEMAFNMLLERSAGNEAIQIYKTHAVDAGWTRRQLREAIISSPEYGIKTGKLMQMYYEGFTFFVNPQEPEIGRGIANSPEFPYEAHNLRLLREILQLGDTFVDVGANIGILSLAARTAVGETGRVICFEPLADNAALLVKSIIANDFNNVVIYPVALSDTVRTLYLEGHSNGMLLSDGRPERRMTTALGDTYLAKEDRIDFLKIDIEGHEPFAFRGLANTLRKHKPMILCEFNPFALNYTLKSDPKAFADQIFSMAKEVQAIDYDGQRTTVSDTASLLDLCEAKNRYFVNQGRIQNGGIHMDLLFKAYRDS